MTKSVAGLLKAHLDRIAPRDYVAFNAYLAMDPRIDSALTNAPPQSP